MARHFVRLKLALIRAGLERAGGPAKAALVLAYVLAVLGGFLFGGILLLFRGIPTDQLVPWVSLAFGAMLLAWAFVPLMGAGSDGTLDADSLALLPLEPDDMMPGLLLTSAIGFGGVVTALTVVGAVGGLVPASPMAVLTVAACLLQFAVCVAAGRLFITLLSMATRKRRWRDLALVIGPLLPLSLHALRFVGFESDPVDGDTPQLPFALRLVTLLLPSGPPALAAAASRQGRLLVALAALGVGVVYLAGLLQLWWRVLQRAMTTAEERASDSSRRPRSLFRGILRWFPRNRVGAVAAKEWLVGWREPRQRAARFAVTFPTLAPFFILTSTGFTTDALVVIAVMPVYFLAAGSTNQFGYDGPKHWLNVAAGDDVRADLLGKNLAIASQCALVAVVVPGVAAALTGAWDRYPLALGLATAAVGLSIGLGNVASVVAPVALPDSDTNLWSAGNPGQGLAAIGPSFAVMAVSGLVLTPLSVAALVVDHPALVAATIAVMVVVGWATWALGLRAAVRRSHHRQPELLALLSD